MCIIIDANKASDFYSASPAKDAEPIHTWIERNGGTVIYAKHGKLKEELNNDSKVMEKFRSLLRDAKINLIDPNKIKLEEEKLKMIECKSNDVHILALARAGGARLLYTADENLKSDFKNKKIIDNPRGKIYSNASHNRLLRKDMCRPPTKPTK